MFIKATISKETGDVKVSNNDTYFTSKPLDERALLYKQAYTAIEKEYLTMVRQYARDNGLAAAKRVFGGTDLQRSV